MSDYPTSDCFAAMRQRLQDAAGITGGQLDAIFDEMGDMGNELSFIGGGAIRQYYGRIAGHEGKPAGVVEIEVTEAQVAFEAIIRHLREGGN